MFSGHDKIEGNAVKRSNTIGANALAGGWRCSTVHSDAT